MNGDRRALLDEVRRLIQTEITSQSEQDVVDLVADEAVTAGVIPFDAGCRVLTARYDQEEAEATVRVLRAVETRLVAELDQDAAR